MLVGGEAAAFEPCDPCALALRAPEAAAAAGVAEADAVDALKMIELASLGEMVVVDVLFEAEAELVPEPVRTNWLRVSDSMSMKPMVGPATIELVA